MGVYFVASRESCDDAERLGKALSYLLPDSVFEKRGEKSIEDCVSRCRLLGKRRLAVVNCESGKVSGINFAKVSADSWNWIEEVKISSFSVTKLLGEKPEVFILAGSIGGDPKKWENLFGARARESEIEIVDDESELLTISCGKTIKFISDGRTIVELSL